MLIFIDFVLSGPFRLRWPLPLLPLFGPPVTADLGPQRAFISPLIYEITPQCRLLCFNRGDSWPTELVSNRLDHAR